MLTISVRVLAVLALVMPASSAWAGSWVDEARNENVLTSHIYRPSAPPRAVAVVLHGCFQTAKNYVTETGWDVVADHMGILIIAPEYIAHQGKFENCMNWHDDDGRRDLSIQKIAEMIKAVPESSRLPVFLTGMSAGAGMAAAILGRRHPSTADINFVGAGLVASPVYGCTDLPRVANVPAGRGNRFGGNECMNSLSVREFLRSEDGRSQLASMLGDRTAEPLKISIWHGIWDNVVHPYNAEASFEQWRMALRLPEAWIVADSPFLHHQVAENMETGQRVEIRNYPIWHLQPICMEISNPWSFMASIGVCSAYMIARDYVGTPIPRWRAAGHLYQQQLHHLEPAIPAGQN